MKRRSFVAGLGAGLAALALGARKRAWTDPRRAPLRLLVVHKPIGTQPDYYDCSGIGRDFTLSPILAPLESVRDHMVVCDGLDILKQPNTPGEDHGNSMVTFMTGGTTFKGDASSQTLAERISIDQILANDPDIGGKAPIRSLQLAADARSFQIFTRTQSYAGKGAPMPPEPRPLAAYARVFGSLADRNLSASELAEARARKQSILDFSRSGLQKLRPELGGDERARLERHLTAIREVEQVLDRTLGQVDLDPLASQVDAVDPALFDENHAALGAAHLAIIRTAFRLDLTRITTFAWASGQSFINFSKIIPGVQNLDAHNISHSGNNKVEDEIAIHTWYNARMAELIGSLRDTEDMDGGSLLDNTIVLYWSEMRLSSHSFESVPIVLFGGAGGRLTGNRRIDFQGRPTNDLWLSIANVLGLGATTIGDAERCTGELPDLFSASTELRSPQRDRQG